MANRAHKKLVKKIHADKLLCRIARAALAVYDHNVMASMMKVPFEPPFGRASLRREAGATADACLIIPDVLPSPLMWFYYFPKPVAWPRHILVS